MHLGNCSSTRRHRSRRAGETIDVDIPKHAMQGVRCTSQYYIYKGSTIQFVLLFLAYTKI